MRILIKEPQDREGVGGDPYDEWAGGYYAGREDILDACVEVDIDDLLKEWLEEAKQIVIYREFDGQRIPSLKYETFSQFLQEKLNNDCYTDGSNIPEELPF